MNMPCSSSASMGYCFIHHAIEEYQCILSLAPSLRSLSAILSSRSLIHHACLDCALKQLLAFPLSFFFSDAALASVQSIAFLGV